MAKKGGYQIVDFKGLQLSSSETTIPGIYESIEGNYNKMTIASGLNFEGNILPDIPATFTVSGSATATIYGKEITITAEDVVTTSE